MPEERQTEADPPPGDNPDVEAFARNMARLVEEGGKAIAAYMKPREEGRIRDETAEQVAEVVRTLGHVAEYWMADPARAIEAQQRLAGGLFDIWSATLRRMSGETPAPVIEPERKDQRFRDPDWSEQPLFDFVKQAYLHTTRWAEQLVEDAKSLDPHTRHKAEFYLRQITAALAPSNFVLTNPELLRTTLASRGENLVRGMRMLAQDMEAGRGHLRIRQTDSAAFEIGANIAATPGKVVFRNELFELIQYAPTTGKVRARPVLIVPPWINKYYILDLGPDKSFVRWAVSQGLTVFVISWVNPGPELADRSFDDYMREGILAALDAVLEIAGEPRADVVGYCIGGTLLAITAAYLAKKRDRRIASITLLTAQIDFTHAGDLMVFVDEDQIAALEKRMADTGYLAGRDMASVFNMLRANDLIWPYVVSNYLKGEEPRSFDLLYWNADPTRLPAANHAFYLRNCYMTNALARGEMTIAGIRIEPNRIKLPAYVLATREDHIAPALSVFTGARLLGGNVRFVLAGSGHIAGVINPPARPKYQYWTGPMSDAAFDGWTESAVEHPGSWWPDWRDWLDKRDRRTVPAREPGSTGHPPLADAPGAYVRVRD